LAWTWLLLFVVSMPASLPVVTAPTAAAADPPQEDVS